MKKCFYLLTVLVVMSFVSCSDKTDLSMLQGVWASYEEGTNTIESGKKGDFLVWTFYQEHLYQQCVQGKYEASVLSGYEDDKNAKNGITFDYTYQDGKLSYNKAEVSVVFDDDDHITVDGTKHWIKLKDLVIGFNKAEQIDLAKYNQQADSMCWSLTQYETGLTRITYSWTNEYGVAANTKKTLETMAGSDAVYYWQRVNADSKSSCEIKNNH